MGITWAEIAAHPAWQGEFKGAKSGFTMPDPASLIEIEFSEENRPRLAKFGISFTGTPGAGNRAFVNDEMRPIETNVDFQNLASGNTFVYLLDILSSKWQYLHTVRAQVSSNDNLAVFNSSWSSFRLQMAQGANAIFVGREISTGSGVHFILCDGTSLQLGDDCMLAWDISVRTGDMHALLDTVSGKVLNRGKSIIVGPHVWIGHDVRVMKGVTIGQGSVVATGSTLASNVPQHAAVAGNPAKIVRRNVTWSREVNPTDVERDYAFASAGISAA